MKYYKFRDKDSDIYGIVINQLDEDGNYSVKYYCKENKCVIYRYRHISEINMSEISKKKYFIMKSL